MGGVADRCRVLHSLRLRRPVTRCMARHRQCSCRTGTDADATSYDGGLHVFILLLTFVVTDPLHRDPCRLSSLIQSASVPQFDLSALFIKPF